MSTTHQSPTGHIVAFALPFWGHTKPLCALLAKIVRLRPVYATLFTDVSIREKVLDELARQFDSVDEDHLRNFIRVVALPSPSVPFQFESLHAAFVEGYRSLYTENPIAVAPDTDAIYDPVPAPQAIILDFFCYESLKGIRTVSGTQVPVYAWQAGAATATLYLFGPESTGGTGDLAEKISRIKTDDQELRDKEIEKLYRRINGKLTNLPGLPPMYDHEHAPQSASSSLKIVRIALALQHCHRFLLECDSVIHATNVLYEKEALKKWKEWFDPRPVIAVGPLSPPASAADIERERLKSPIGADVETFLNDALNKYGPNSVVYISFGTNFWSPEPEKIWTVIDVLLEQGTPFLFSHASRLATVPAEVLNKIKASGLGYAAQWLPQQVILRHKACGWFVSHCGHNSVMESLTAGVPLIAWPFEADQPANAANIAFVHGVGYELFEVRTGHGLRPVHRLGGRAPSGTLDAVKQEALDVLGGAFGKDGEVKRAKAQWFSEQFAKIWQEDGMGWDELRNLVDRLN